MRNDTKEAFNHLADTGVWPSRYDASDIENYNFITRRESVARLLERDRFGSVLDLGCGTGDFCELLSGVSSEYIGVDFSPTMIQRATLTYGHRRSGSRPSFVESSAEALPFSENRFDLVCAIGFIEYFSDPVEPLREIVRVLRPGGTLVIQSFQIDLFRRMGRAAGVDAFKRLLKGWYGRIIGAPVATGFTIDKPYSSEQLDGLMKSFDFVKMAHRYSNYLVLPKTFRRIAPRVNVRGSEMLTRRQPAWLSGLAVNYVGRYMLGKTALSAP